MWPSMTGGTGIWCDLYELTMAVSYLEHGMGGGAVFSLFARDLPPDRGYLVVGGVDDAVDAVCALGFADDDLGYLRDIGFSSAAINRLAGLRFTGDVWAVPEGRIVTADEPILEVTAPIAEAQLVETLVLNQVTYQTAIATKAARCREAARGKVDLVDFAFRRAHGVEAAVAVARLSAMVGFTGTSNVAAARRFRLHAVGTMAHSFVQAFPTERRAFEAFAGTFPERATFLVDTYDTLTGVDHAIEVIDKLGLVHNVGVRLDSGDLGALARAARARLDDAGLSRVRIFASGGLDEYAIGGLVRSGAPIDAVGVGTKMGVAADAPYLDTAYKLVSYDGRPVRKLSTGKASIPGAKQVWRRGTPGCDLITARDETVDGAEALLVPMVRNGRRVTERPSLTSLRQRFDTDLQALPTTARPIHSPWPLTARFSAALLHLAQVADEAHDQAERRDITPGRYNARTGLVVVDVQNDFADPHGSLYVNGADAAIEAINAEVQAAREAGATVVYTQDWHPPDTPHFAKDGGTWPVHCVAGTWGAHLHPKLVVDGRQVHKGTGGEDGYSGFTVADPVTGATTPTRLQKVLEAADIDRLVVVGLATDYCVKATALDALTLGYPTSVVQAAIRPVELQPGDGDRAIAAMRAAGITVL